MKLDIASYCNRKIACSCGRTHFCPITDVVVESGALKALPELLQEYKQILLVADQNTYKVCGEEVRLLLGEKVKDVLIYECEGFLVPDEQAVEKLDQQIRPGIDFVVGIGSGVINDICKYATYLRKMDYAIVATAPSMDGYASSGAAMIYGGMKITFTTRPPKMIIADTRVIRQAPMEMIRSGYGDIIGKFSSLCDWRLSQLVNGEYFCPETYELVMEVTKETRRQVQGIVNREEEAIEFLTKALILIGITLSLVETTRPGSGSEHHLSHFFEIVGLIHGKPYFLHGTDVAYSTVVTADMRKRIRMQEKPAFAAVPACMREKAYERIYAGYAGEVAKIQKKAGFYEKDLFSVYEEKWPEICEVLAECPDGEEITAMLTDAGYDMDEFEGMYGKEKICDAMHYGKDLKDRYSVLWLYEALFGEGNRA